MNTTKMTASRSMKYGTRRLEAGDVFDVQNRHVKVLEAVKRAKVATGSVPPMPAALKTRVSRPVPTPAPAKPVPAEAEPVEPVADQAGEEQTGEAVSEDLTELRAEYERVIGRRPFMGWGGDVLRQKIVDAAE